MTNAQDPDRLLKRLWLVNGFALLALLLFAIGAAGVAWVSDMSRDRAAAVVAAAPPADGPDGAGGRIRAVRFDVPARVRGTETRIVLVHNGAEFLSPPRRSRAVYASEASGDDERVGPIVNVVFMPPSGAQGRLLFDRPAYVNTVSYPGKEYSHADSTQTWITYEAALEDTNGDGKLDEEDRRELLVTDLDGQNLRHVLPAGWRFKEFESMGDGRSLAVTALEAPAAGHEQEWDERRAVERAFLYDVPAGALRPFPALDSLVAHAGRLLGGTPTR